MLVMGKYVEVTDKVILKLQAYNILVGHIILMCSAVGIWIKSLLSEVEWLAEYT
jgi:hypothetical protein